MTEKESSCTSVETNISIALGKYFNIPHQDLPLHQFRKGKDYTYLYGKHVGIGSLTPYIDGAFDPRVDELRAHSILESNLVDNLNLKALFWMERCWSGIQYPNETYHLGH